MLLLLLWITVSQNTDIDEFRAIRAFRCDFTEGTGRRYSAKGELSVVSAPEPVRRVETHSIDYGGRSALVSSEASANAFSVSLTAGKRATSFLMTSIDGDPMLQTIFASPRPPNSPDRYFAVLSRHVTDDRGESKAEQLYGTCQATRR
jgi:hypothetical protein